jgi:hypothetical protein
MSREPLKPPPVPVLKEPKMSDRGISATGYKEYLKQKENYGL